MSKSLGNSILAKDVLSRHTGNGVRYFFLSTHYRAPVNYTEENLDNADKQVNRYFAAIRKAKYKLALNDISCDEFIESDYLEALNALANDLNVSNCLTVIDRELKEINTLSMQKNADLNRLAMLVNTFVKISDVLGLIYNIEELTDVDRENYLQYNKAREEKDYAKSDIYRNKLMEKGIL
jgi:cysteinyl-tRNA synthetase